MTTKKRRAALASAEIALMSALISICAVLCVPTVPPFTLATLAMHLALLILGGRAGLISIAVYVAMGVIGLPVFAGFSGGIGHLLGASGGFIIGYVVAAIAYMILELLLPKRDLIKAVLSCIFIIIVYIFGSLWFAYIYGSGNAGAFLSALSVCVIPFIIPDAAKLIAALLIYKKINKHKFGGSAKNG